MGQQKKDAAQSVAAVAAQNVDSYLRGVTSRARVPSATGGRGTRRRLASQAEVAAAKIKEQPKSLDDFADADNGDDEWEEVMLPTSFTPSSSTKPEVKVKDEKNGIVETPEFGATGPNPGQGSVKAELVDLTDEENRHNRILASVTPMGGQQSSSPSSGQWRQRDPAYEQMLEQQQLLAAKRRSERTKRAVEEISTLLFALLRGRKIVQQARHPKLVRGLLRLYVVEDATSKTYPLLRAVLQAKGLYAKAMNPAVSTPSLAPCWVTANKDSVNNYTSASISALLRGIECVFVLDGGIEHAALSNWAAPIQPGYLFEQLRKYRYSIGSPGCRIVLPHSLYICAVFLSLAAVSNVSCRLVVAVERMRRGDMSEKSGSDGGSPPKEAMSLFGSGKKRKRGDDAGAKQNTPKRLPSSCFWLEVWCPQRQSYISVNPCGGCATLFAAPYTFSVGGDAIMDVTPRYSIKYSSAFTHRLGRCDRYRHIWKDLQWNDNREASEVIVDLFRRDVGKYTEAQMQREKKQLHSLTYAEEVPKTLTALQKHPLFILENGLSRYEGIYPKDSTTMVGSVKGHIVFKRSAVVSLRSRDGWLREGRTVSGEEEPYKVIPPPPSRPFSKSSALFGVWQTKPFAPEPLGEDGSIPKHGNTQWYILLDKPAPIGLVHMQQPNIIRVARRMNIDFGIVVTGYRRRRLNEARSSGWEVVTDGIIVKETNTGSLVKAYEEWKQLTEEQEAAKRKQRAYRWWMHFVQHRLAYLRIRQQYLEGATHGHLSSH
ncbi:DNA-repair protein [Trypanosoma brucei equiperdum]|uniref:DNA-repair protein n=1 Tax=Trypanosoma brucei equiperdum TaxID=630700 RepID=A0A3L6L2G3_9TRYP|nr:DNA-repair protein [Trypanosoma brucei equiperdum]